MKLCYNVTGQERKALVGAISHELNAPTKYLAAPTFAYEVGGYHIDKTGMVTGKDNLDLEDALHRQGFDAAEREYDEPDTYESGLGGMGALESPEELGLVPVSELDELVIEVPLIGFTPEKLGNLTKLVAAKAPLLRAALGISDLPIQQTDDTLRFPWFKGGLDTDTIRAYTTLVAKICETAKEKHRVTAKERAFDNPKYAMRCWLLSLGFIGDEYKQMRKILLKNLNGNSSYRSRLR
jgi:hypothetical protein